MELQKHTGILPIIRISTILVLSLVILSGCGVKRPVPQPTYPSYPSYPPATQPQVEPQQPVTVPTTIYTPKIGPAGSLYYSAKKSLGSGDTQKAEMTMERALRIEPKNGHYWYTMGQIKFQQQQYAQSVHLCLKSKSLAGNDQNLLILNDVLMKKAREQMNAK
ncbi:tetratricopeptide repeat protein [Desulfosediminicola flagellatus]|uniref:tetratricopeptide repeat protein n=1 Tax=Desulfosediminicola flagellatus TaxID=2569541 RepID=UPI0010ACDA04|nr:hypothetical protein [Desulfosediminicola flagellatus]